MHTTHIVLRCGMPAAAAVILPLTATVGTAGATVSDINVTATGATVSAVTNACTRQNGSWGNAALLSAGQTSFAEGRQAALDGTSVSQSTAWYNIPPGTYTVIVMCSNGTIAGTKPVTVTSRTSATLPASSQPTFPASSELTLPASPQPTLGASSQPTRGATAGIGGTTRDYRSLTYAAGGVLLVAGLTATGWYLRRRTKPHR
ncbi:hypothetical protein ABZ471_39445 [Streptomyces sp. NPDC005728]|uniref:hypothetical protein n=1 Tax=Streptomyces sp. NPDC005728 TaxID=3157054 RepID=UPI0033E134C7